MTSVPLTPVLHFCFLEAHDQLPEQATGKKVQVPLANVRRLAALECTVMKDVIVVRHPEFARLRHQLAVATERFNQTTKARQESIALIGSLQTITAEDRDAFLEQIEAEQEAYEEIKDLHDKILRLLRDKPQAKAATNDLR